MSVGELYAVIIAGGKGKRFWPLSRNARPKQLLAFDGDKTLLAHTVERILPLVPSERIYVVTGKSHADGVYTALPDLPRENVLVEPVGKNTAPAISLAAAHIMKRDPEAVMVVLPADHLVGKSDRFRDDISLAVEYALAGDRLVTFGVNPTRPETGYGYIKVAGNIKGQVFRVQSFTEKPNRKKARYYLDMGGYLWNSGMFVFKTSVLMEHVRTCLPKLYSAWESFRASAMDSEALNTFYGAVDSESIDYGVMEKLDEPLAVVAASFSWSDIGYWGALDEIWEADEQGNRKGKGQVVALRAEGNTVVSNKLVALMGVEDLIVVETDDAILVCRKDRSQEVKSLVDEIERQGLKEFL